VFEKLIKIIFKIFRKGVQPVKEFWIGNRLKNLNDREKFNLIYRTGYWKNSTNSSVSGAGSDHIATINITHSLTELFKKQKPSTLLDAPCGDFSFMKNIDLTNINYVGLDLVDDLIVKNNKKYKRKNIKFIQGDIIKDSIPCFDIIFVRDCFVHLEDKQIIEAINNIIKSDSKYLISTTFKGKVKNNQSNDYDRWRPINLEMDPFLLPPPISYLDDRNKKYESDFDKWMGVWKIRDLKKGKYA
jgi:hypothetical protein